MMADLETDDILYCPRGKTDSPDPMHPFKCYRPDKKILIKAKRTLAAAAELRAKISADTGSPPPAPGVCPHCGRREDPQPQLKAPHLSCAEQHHKPTPHIDFIFELEAKESSTPRYHFRFGTIRKPNGETIKEGFCY